MWLVAFILYHTDNRTLSPSQKVLLDSMALKFSKDIEKKVGEESEKTFILIKFRIGKGLFLRLESTFHLPEVQ